MKNLVDSRGAVDGDAPRLRLVIGGRPDAPAEHRWIDTEQRRRIVDARGWALTQGLPMEADALTVLFGTLDDDELIDRVSPTLWTEERVLEFVWTTALFWCQENDVDPPAGLTETLESWFAYIDDTCGFAPGSDSVDVLAAALASCTAPKRRKRRALSGAS